MVLLPSHGDGASSAQFSVTVLPTALTNSHQVRVVLVQRTRSMVCLYTLTSMLVPARLVVWYQMLCVNPRIALHHNMSCFPSVAMCPCPAMSCNLT